VLLGLVAGLVIAEGLARWFRPQPRVQLHAKLVLYPAPPLDRPFSETVASPPDWHAILVDFGHAHGIPVYPLERELVDQDYLRVRQDPCCHYNVEGHRTLVPVMERVILQQLGPSPSVEQQ